MHWWAKFYQGLSIWTHYLASHDARILRGTDLWHGTNINEFVRHARPFECSKIMFLPVSKREPELFLLFSWTLELTWSKVQTFACSHLYTITALDLRGRQHCSKTFSKTTRVDAKIVVKEHITRKREMHAWRPVTENHFVRLQNLTFIRSQSRDLNFSFLRCRN